MQIFILKNGHQTGPLSIEQVNQGLVKGTLEGADLAWHGGLLEWIQLRDMKEITLPSGSVPPKFDPSAFNALLKTLEEPPLVDRWCRFLFPGSKK